MAFITFPMMLVAFAASQTFLFLVRSVYNILWHPLSKIPGLKLAAASDWYEVYFDLCRGQSGQYIHEIDRQHDIFGAIVRINSREVHIRDESFRQSLYSRGRQVDKDIRHAALFGLPLSLFGTVLHETHRARRAALNPFFSKGSVIRLEPLIRRHVRSVCDSLGQIGREGRTVELRHAMIAVTVDIISEYAFGDHFGASESPASWPKWEAMMSGVAEGVPAAKSFPRLYSILMKMPRSVIRTLSRTLSDYLDYVSVIRIRVRTALETHRLNASQTDIVGVGLEKPARLAGVQPTIFTEMLDSPLPASEKSEDRFTEEAVGIVSAGSETTALTIATTLFHILEQPEVVRKIREELQRVMPTRRSSADWRQLEQLPTLSAAVKEGLRISTSICGRLPVVLDEEVQYQGYRIPPHSPISMSPRHALMDPEIFIEPSRFEPRRWLEAGPTQRMLMGRAFVPFNQGPRMCLGLSLANAEMHHIISCMLARFEFELVHTLRQRDVDLCRDCFASKPRKESMGIRVRIVKEFEDHW